MALTEHLVEDNIAFLLQARELVKRLSNAAYSLSGPAVHGSGVGPHLRHVLDHYANFLAGIGAGRIDYDARARDPMIESDRSAAIAKLDELVAGLRALLSRTDGPLAVKMDCGDDSPPESWWSTSSVCRELQFLISHTVHHYALIRIVLKLQGIDPGPAFGVAPSTLRHHARLACAQ